MVTLARLSAADLCRALHRYRDVLAAHREELNALNVYPVPDGDTGTNMLATVESVMAELSTAGPRHDMAGACRAISHGSLMGARGNSGVILSQVLRGLADEFGTGPDVGPAELRAGLRRGTDAAYRAVLRPVEGTILTVSRRAADAAEAVPDGGPVSAMLDEVCEAADAAVAETPSLLPVLAQAGVVDAGGRGLFLLLATMREVAGGAAVPDPERVVAPAAVAAALAGGHDALDPASPRYEVMFLLDADDGGVDGMRRTWAGLGDSIVVVGGDGLWNCHVHTDDVGGAIEAGIEAGRPHGIRVTDLFEAGPDHRHPAAGPAEVDVPATGVVAVGAGAGLRALLAALGAGAVVTGGQSANPSTAEILDGVSRCAGQGVVVLPNNKNVVPVARQVPDLVDRPVGIVPTRSIPAGVAALAVLDPDASLEENVAAMTDAAARVRAGEVTRAVRDAVVEAGPVRAGQWIGVEEGGVHVVAPTAADAVVAMVDRLVADDGELVTVLVGEGATAGDTVRLRAHLATAHPEVEVEVHDGGQPLYAFLVGVE